MATQHNAKMKRIAKDADRARKEITLVVGDVWEFSRPVFHLYSGKITTENITVEIISLGLHGMMTIKRSGFSENTNITNTNLKINIMKLKARKISSTN